MQKWRCLEPCSQATESMAGSSVGLTACGDLVRIGGQDAGRSGAVLAHACRGHCSRPDTVGLGIGALLGYAPELPASSVCHGHSYVVAERLWQQDLPSALHPLLAARINSTSS